MSNAIFPLLPGLAWPVVKTPNWGTRMQRSVSGRTLRTSDYANPIWNFTLILNFLHDQSFRSFVTPFTALRSLQDFFNSRAGAFDSFLYTDPTDNSALGQSLVAAPADTTGTVFQLTRQLLPGGFNEWVIAPNLVSALYFNGAAPNIASSIDFSTGLVTFASPPPAGTAITADLSYYFRVYFDDALDFENFAYQLWELKKLKLTSVVL